MLELGADVPQHPLLLDDGEVTQPADFNHRTTLFVWLPDAESEGCTTQLLGLRDQAEAFEDLDCSILGLSCSSVTAARATRLRLRLPFRIAVTDTRRALLWDACDADMTIRPVAYLADPSRGIARRYLVVDPEFFAEGVLDDLEALGTSGGPTS